MSRLGEQAVELRRAERSLLDDERSAVHDARVATRRLRSLVRRAGSWVGEEPTAALHAELGWLARSLSPARDAEVSDLRIRASLGSPALSSVPEVERADIEQGLDRARRTAYDAALAAVASPRYRLMLAELDRLVAAEPSTAPPDAVDHVAELRSLQRGWKRLVKHAARTDQADPGEHLHDLRKRAKRLRYATEPLVPTVGKPARRFTKRLKKVQSLLGEHHDTLITREAIAGLIDQFGSTRTLEYLGLAEEEAAESLEREFADSWPRTVRRQAGRWPAASALSVVEVVDVKGPSAGGEVG